MKRFLLKYEIEGIAPRTLEGIEFSSGVVVIDGDFFVGVHLSNIEELKRKFPESEARIEWIDNESEPTTGRHTAL